MLLLLAKLTVAFPPSLLLSIQISIQTPSYLDDFYQRTEYEIASLDFNYVKHYLDM